jgi:hypothetical protein
MGSLALTVKMPVPMVRGMLTRSALLYGLQVSVPKCQAMDRRNVVSLSNFNTYFVDGVALLRPKILPVLFRAVGELQRLDLLTVKPTIYDGASGCNLWKSFTPAASFYEGCLPSNPVIGTRLQGAFNAWIYRHCCVPYSEKHPGTFLPHRVHLVSCFRCDAADIHQERDCATTIQYYEGHTRSNLVGGT